LLRDVSGAGRTFGSGLFAYVLRPKAAVALLAAAAAHPITQPVDWYKTERKQAFQKSACDNSGSREIERVGKQ
jgi:hypothetical protein